MRHPIDMLRRTAAEARDALERVDEHREVGEYVAAGAILRVRIDIATGDIDRIADSLDRALDDPDELRRLADLAEERLEAEEEARAAALEAEVEEDEEEMNA